MYKVVVVDDEPIIVKGLTQLIPWEKYGCEVVGTAEDGMEGLEVIRKCRPDIIFSDIYMPKMNGLLMAAALKSEFEDTQLTILTGYRDFELAQEAIRLGVTRYILKPSNMEELEEALCAMVQNLQKKGIDGQTGAEAGQNPPGQTMEKSNQGQIKEKSNPEKRTEMNGRGQIPVKDNPEMNGREQIPVKGNPEMNGREQMPVKNNPVKRPEQGQKSGEALRETGEAKTPAGSFLVNKALEYMQKNYRRKVTLTDVADSIFVSQWHLSKLLNSHTGQSFSELMNSIRVEEAKKLLEDPALRVGDVAEQVGFVDMAHFSRVFKKVTGISANEFRNRL